jgi:hypothetical protein
MNDLPKALGIDHIVDRIYISGWRATHYDGYLRQAGITHILKLYEGIPSFPADFDVCENPVEDGELIPADQLRRGVDFVIEQLEAGRPVLVMCGAGISRSATFVLAALVQRGYDLHDAFVLLRAKHNEATPHPNLWLSLIAYYGLPYKLPDVMEWMHRDDNAAQP